MKVLVTGGMGFVGHGLVKKLVSQGHEVHVLGRTPSPPREKMIPGIIYHTHDLSAQYLDDPWFTDTDTVYHVAARAGVDGRYEDYRLANFVATKQLLDASQKAGVARFIFTSTPSVAFSTDPICEGDESLPYSKKRISPYATTKALAEQTVLSANDPSGMRTLALRPHLVWGSGDPHLLPRVISRHREGKLKRVGNGENRVDLTHVDNVVHAHLCAFQAMVSNPSLGGKAYFISQNEPVNLWAWLDQLFVEIGLPTLQKSLSYLTAYRIGWVLENIWKLLPLKNDPPMTRFVACQLAHDHWFSSSAAAQDLHYQPVITMAQAMEKTLPWLRKL